MNLTASNSTGFNRSAVPLTARVLMAAIFLISGAGKAIDPAGTIGYIASAGLPSPAAVYIVALVLELGAGTLLLIGWRVRWAAALLGLFAVVSALVFHCALGDGSQLIHFLKNLAIAGGMLQVMAFVSGAYSIDGPVRQNGLAE